MRVAHIVPPPEPNSLPLWSAYAVMAGADPAAASARAKALGFDIVLGSPAPTAPTPAGQQFAADEAVRDMANAAHREGLRCWLMLVLDEVRSDHALAASGAFTLPPLRAQTPIDPRRPVQRDVGPVWLRRPRDPHVFDWWQDRLARFTALGADGFAAAPTHAAGCDLAASLSQAGYQVALLAPPLDGVAAIPAKRAVHTLPAVIGGACGAPSQHGLALAAIAGSAWVLQAGAEAGLESAVGAVNGVLRAYPPGGSVRQWTRPAGPWAITSRAAGDAALVMVQNTGATARRWPPAQLPPLPWQDLVPVEGFAAAGAELAPGETILLHGRRAPPVALPAPISVAGAANPAARIVITEVSPAVDGGAFAAKCIVGERVAVRAGVIADGHEKLAACVLTRAADEQCWARHEMRAEPNDVFSTSVHFSRLGRHEMQVEAWLDVWGGFARDLAAKFAAGHDLALELREALALIDAAIGRTPDGCQAACMETLQAARALAAGFQLDSGTDQAPIIRTLLSAAVGDAMAQADERRFLTRGFVQPMEVEREAARFSSWYEMFPRSQTTDPGRHGSFADVRAQLPRIAAMGFDTVYFPPIHPIGRAHRKGRNNAPAAAAGDVGSPYAIGAREGGHCAVHPDLGTLDDFRDLVSAARVHGLEVALDFAVQCAPDHPWLRDHPGWFAWRPDGSLKYAENPPKKYQDIVNVEFYADDARPELWQALRDIVLFWIEQGVLVFRVDNPHTKPLPFWQWMIADIKSRHPNAIFLSEAFTTPRRMYHLAKAGFSQSYSYFTWRNNKTELTTYLLELTAAPVRDFFRPHFFPCTPDINPFFLQQSGRAGFLIRAVLAATLSGLWGVYAGFELCEAAALPGREEYLDSEKYEIRPRPARAPGDIVDEITQLNFLRRAYPALQNHVGVSFHNAFNDLVLYFSKSAPDDDDLVLVMVNLDPHATQSTDFEVPLWLFGLGDGDSVHAEDLLTGTGFRWTGKQQQITLNPSHPYRIWRITKARA